MSHDFNVIGADTDSIIFCKKDGSVFDKNEQEELLNEINSLLPKNIVFAHDGIFPKVISLKTKNYILKDENGKIKYKGSSLRNPSLEPALKEFLERTVTAILEDKTNFEEIYKEYVKEALDIKDIKRWVTRKTISSKTLESERTNESKIRDAIENTEYVEGDRIFVYFADDLSLKLSEKFDGKYDKKTLLVKLFKTTDRFSTVLNTKELFKNYGLKKHQEELNAIIS